MCYRLCGVERFLLWVALGNWGRFLHACVCLISLLPVCPRCDIIPHHTLAHFNSFEMSFLNTHRRLGNVCRKTPWQVHICCDFQMPSHAHQSAASVLLKTWAVCLLNANTVVSNHTKFPQTRQNVTVGALMLQINPVTYKLLEIKGKKGKSPNSDMASRKPFEATDCLFCSLLAKRNSTVLLGADNAQGCLSSLLASSVVYHYINLILPVIKCLKRSCSALLSWQGGRLSDFCCPVELSTLKFFTQINFFWWNIL